ncbi:MAG: amidohydrolase family protein [Gemmatimonadota bacterium]|nr:amidohydrolase family protein [Gemmatimonadota bacterium]
MKRSWLAAAVLLAACGDAGETYDVVIQGGSLVDGTGAPAREADVALKEGRIAAVGDLADAAATTRIDATGLVVAPGFIDVHSHSGPGLASSGLSHAQPLLAQGLTTVFVNPDGGGPVDLVEQQAALLEHGLGVNAAQFISHGSVRGEVLGSEDRAPSPEELARMEELVRVAMENGAWGLSSGTFYAPGSFSKPDEIIALARVVAEYGGAYESHIRDESSYTVGVVAAVDEVIDVARQAGIPAVVTHIKALGPPVWGTSTEIIEHIRAAREDEGLQVWADQYPYEASATGLDAALLPRWAQAGGRDALRERLADRATRARIRAEMEENLARRGGADRIQFRRYTPDPAIEGRKLSDLATERGRPALDVALDLIEGGSASIVSFNMSEDDVRAFMVQPWTMTSSDGDLVPMNEGVPHPRSYGAFPRKIRRYVVEEGVVDLPQAIHSMTGLPAQVFGIPDRGRIEPGLMADVVVFDLSAVRDAATYTQPHQLAEGMVHVFVNGRPAIQDGRFTGGLHGEVLIHPRPGAEQEGDGPR